MTKLIEHNHEFDEAIRNKIKFQEEEAFVHNTPNSKGEMMKLVYTKEELRHIDSAIPVAYWDGKNKSIQIDSSIHVVNYNEPNSWGVLENLEDVAKKRKIHWKGL